MSIIFLVCFSSDPRYHVAQIVAVESVKLSLAAVLSTTITALHQQHSLEPFVGAYFGYTGGRGKLTGTYKRLASLIDTQSSNFDSGDIV